MARHRQPFTNQSDPERRIRVGYVSSDFRRHPVGFFLQPVLNSHDRAQVEVFCYSSHPQTDDLTEQLRSRADGWRTIASSDDDAAAELIRSDAIDILVDLGGHSGFNRLPTFARKPAPIQASWLGYADTTGLPNIDYLISDRFVCPEQEDGAVVEQVVRLPEAFLCYTPPEDAPPVPPLPALSRGHVTFGCFNNIAKVTPDVIRLWAEILRAVPESRLFLKTRSLGEHSVRSRYASLFAHHEVSPERVVFEGASPRADYLAAYGRVDIALDPFPFNGGTTTLDALWMGVPVISLQGDRPVCRLGASHLSAAGCGDLVVRSPQDYLQKAVALASDVRQLSHLRAALRRQVLDSPICDSSRFTRGLEKAYRAMWHGWCRQAPQAC
jgi:predicted O-linked N-acetylglucosamine transferase (SPINDLY family)